MNFSDPFGLCPPCDNWTPAEEDYELRMAHEGAKHPGLAVAAAGIMLGGTGMAFLGGSSVGMVAARFAPAGVVVGKGTDKLIDMLEESGPSMASRIQAVSRWLPAGQRALMTPLEGGARMLSGGAGERARQIILQANGETVIKALNVTKKTYEVIATIRPK